MVPHPSQKTTIQTNAIILKPNFQWGLSRYLPIPCIYFDTANWLFYGIVRQVGSSWMLPESHQNSINAKFSTSRQNYSPDIYIHLVKHLQYLIWNALVDTAYWYMNPWIKGEPRRSPVLKSFPLNAYRCHKKLNTLCNSKNNQYRAENPKIRVIKFLSY